MPEEENEEISIPDETINNIVEEESNEQPDNEQSDDGDDDVLDWGGMNKSIERDEE